MISQALQIRFRNSSKLFIGKEYAILFKYSHKNKSKGLKSEDRGHHVTDLSRPIHL